jgi:hypothetical protein
MWNMEKTMAMRISKNMDTHFKVKVNDTAVKQVDRNSEGNTDGYIKRRK